MSSPFLLGDLQCIGYTLFCMLGHSCKYRSLSCPIVVIVPSHLYPILLRENQELTTLIIELNEP